MSRNPHAASLRAHKPKRIEDKRQDERKRQAEREALRAEINKHFSKTLAYLAK